MPLYEYQCKECGRHTEKIQKFSDPELTKCPHCGGPLERTLTAPAVQFKGSGWYKDLYSSAKPAASTNNDSAKSGDAGSGSKPADSPAASSASEKSSSSASAAPASAPAAPATKS
ncbi:MAG TPA: zinc ribbon domain-containing protein [Candidatus Aquilonibacter sp.]|nr:zinc ribbon domain-containing protein [Candidatus Aquilonibacter sp.]